MHLLVSDARALRALEPDVAALEPATRASYATTISSLAPLGRHIRALYDTFATTFPAASRTFAPCSLRICRYYSELDRIPLARALVAR